MTFYTPEEVKDVLSRPLLGDDTKIHTFLLRFLGLSWYKWKKTGSKGRQEIRKSVFDYIDLLISDTPEGEDALKAFTFALNCAYLAESYKKAGPYSDIALAIRFLCTEEEEDILSRYYFKKVSFFHIGKATRHSPDIIKRMIEDSISRVTKALINQNQHC